MSLVNATIEIASLEVALQILGDILSLSVQRTAEASAARVQPQIQALAEAPRPVAYPIQWRSARQRKAFFASRGFGKGIPYQRTGAAAAGWRVDAVRVDDSTLVGLSNAVPYSGFVYGLVNDATYQQPFHRVTGWAGADDLTTVGLELFQDDFNNTLTDSARRLIEVRL